MEGREPSLDPLIARPDDESMTPSAAGKDGGASSRAVEGRGGPPAEQQSCLALLRNAVRNPDQLTAMISNYSTSYNTVNVGIVLPVLDYAMQEKASGGEGGLSLSEIASSISRRLDDFADKEEKDEHESLVASSLLAGMIVGQLIGGFLGDVLGRRNAMLLVMVLQIGGSLGSAFISTDDEEEGFAALEQLAAWRFILGIGAGGVYPLAAVMSAENKAEEDSKEWDTAENRGRDAPRSSHDANGESAGGKEDVSTGKNYSGTDAASGSFQRIALTFSTQGLGFITVPIVASLLLSWNVNADAIWRTLLGIGALPGVWVLYLRLCSGRGYARLGRHGSAEFERSVAGISMPAEDSSVVEMATPENNGHENNGDSTEGGNLTSQVAPSTLFSDVASSDANGASADQNENELALVDNSHMESVRDTSSAPVRHRGLWESILAEPNLGIKFAGTAGTWFLFDVTFYGNTLFEPFVLEAALGSQSENATDGYELLKSTVRGSLVIGLLSLPGYFVTVFLIGRRTCMCQSLRARTSSTRFGSSSCFPCEQTPVYIQMQGFFFMFLLYILIGIFWSSLENVQWLLLVLYAGTFFFANYGPNTTTFLLPSVTYSEECRSTLNGISAAAGKVGALVGASVFEPAVDMWGESAVMACCGCVSLLAFLLTKNCVGGSGASGR